MKKWKCLVCGYIHTGEEPPETCPVCGADRSRFVELAAEKPATPAPADIPDEAPAAAGFYPRLAALITKHHLHPIAVHIPNGVAPVAVIFTLLAVLFHFDNLAAAAYYNMVFVVLAMPVVLFSGYVDWKNRFGGRLTSLFLIKIVCGLVVSAAAVAIVVWRMVDPQVAAAESPHRWAFVLVHLALLAAAVVAGLMGGKLVFKNDA